MRYVAVALALALLAVPGWSQDKADQPLKIRTIVAYKHGVGYFERQGKVTDDQQITLTFKAAQMKDLLKSLYAVDLSGGRIATISYDTKDPLSKQLEDILIRVPEGNALTQFLTQLKGARVEATVGGDVAAGSVVGIEPVARQTKDGVTMSWKLVLFRDDGRIQPVDLLEVSNIRLLDEALQKDLKRMLEIHLKTKYADRKSVVFNATGRGERDVRVGYIVETPIWKTSYRLLFDEGDKPLFQGWAILENTTDEDWEDVDVSFVAGTPMSFVMDLYTAYYPRRPEIGVGVAAAPAPEEMAKKMAPQAPMARGRMKDKRREYEDEARAAEAEADLAEALEGAVAPAVEGVEVGELFVYRSREKVSIKRGQAALVPILSERLEEGERVLFYRPRVSARPMNAYLFKNSTALTLETGPVTFFEGSTCIGEGLMRKILKQGMKDILPYAVEAGVTIEPKVDHRADPVTQGRIADGVLTLTHSQNIETVYTIKSQIQKDAVLYVDHAKAEGYSLAVPAKAEEEVEGHYRFRVSLRAGETTELRVPETTQISSIVALIGTPAETIRFYGSQRYLSDRARAFLEELAGMQGEINALRQTEAELNAERQRLAEDQERARQNLQVLRDTPQELEMRRKYLARMEGAETRIEEIRKSLKETIEKRTGLERQMAAKVREFKEE